MRPSIAYSAVFSVDKTTESTCRSTEKLSRRGWPRLVSNLITVSTLGGIWADKISGKLVLGFGVIWWSATTVLTPIAARVGLPFLLVMRAFMGIGEAKWFPQQLIFTHFSALLDRGWRRSGCFLYKPEMESICCPSYTIRLKASDFVTSKEQLRVSKRMQR